MATSSRRADQVREVLAGGPLTAEALVIVLTTENPDMTAGMVYGGLQALERVGEVTRVPGGKPLKWCLTPLGRLQLRQKQAAAGTSHGA